MISLDLSGLQLRLKQEDEKTLVFDPVRKKWVKLTPEEHVRQYLLQYMIQALHYPAALTAVERKITNGALTKRFDVVVYNRNHQPWLLAECKEPEIPISEDTLFQLLHYHRNIPCRYWLLTNGHQMFCADAGDIGNIRWMDGLPLYEL